MARPPPSGAEGKPLLSYLSPYKPAWCSTSLPELCNVERPPGGLCASKKDFVRVLDELRGNVNDLDRGSRSGWADLYDRRAHVLFERLAEKESNEHRVKACHIGLDLSVGLAATDVTYPQLDEDPKEFLIEKPLSIKSINLAKERRVTG